MVVALAAEAGVLAGRRLRPGMVERLEAGVLVQLCGMGPAAAAAAAQALADAGASALAVFGVAGALDPGFAPGTLLCPAQIVAEDGDHYAVDSAWRFRLAGRLGESLSDRTLLTVRLPLLTPQAKAEAQRRFDAVAVDMESAAVAGVARSRGLPLLVLRAIADGAGDSIPGPLADAIDRWGRARPLAVAAALLRQPPMLLRLPRLAGTMNRATVALRSAIRASGADLAYGPASHLANEANQAVRE